MSNPPVSDDFSEPLTLGRVMRRPRWLGLLVLALAVSAAFAWLGQWQLERALVSIEPEQNDTETVVPIEDVLEPASPMRDADVARMVIAEGTFIEGDALVVGNRVDGGETGYWVSGHFQTSEGIALAVALGWTADRDVADDVADRLNEEGFPEPMASTVEGRLIPSQGPAEPSEDDPFELRSLSVAQLINLWSGMEERDVYSAFVLSSTAPEGLAVIDAPPPTPNVELNWLNIFYAAEWVVFAGFAIFLWYRLARDAWEREVEERAGGEESASGERIQ